MKKNRLALILAGMLAVSIAGCGSQQQEATELPAKNETEQMQEDGMTEENASSQKKGGEQEAASSQKNSEETEDSASREESGFSFTDLKNLQFDFSSGAGGWSTQLIIDADGSFRGEYSDSDMGVTGDDYPDGTVYQCDFTGQFTQPVKVNAYTYSMQILSIKYEKEVGTEEIKDGVKYCYSTAYGLDGAENILLYLPGAPLAELPEEFRSWVGYYDLSAVEETELPFYALNNEELQEGFSSYNCIDNLKEMLKFVEESAAALENSIQNDSLTQTEYNEKTGELYQLWDDALNMVWNVLKQTQEKEKMESVTEEEREWITWKEQEIAGEGGTYEGGSMQAMVINQKAAELTKNRVYELMKLFD